jgi:hypothetical protein
VRYWLQLDEADQASFDAAAKQVSNLYRRAAVLHQRGVHVVCCDEKTGIQALERASQTRSPIPGSVEQQEAHYIRHGTRTLIANFEVATGQILTPSLGPTRNEHDFAHHVSRTVALDPDAEWIFIVDNLYPRVGVLGSVRRKCLPSAPRLGFQRPLWDPSIHVHSYALPDQHATPYPLRLYAKTSFLAQSNRTVVQHLGPPTSPPRQFRVCETSSTSTKPWPSHSSGLTGPTVDHLNQKRICVDED